MREKLRINNDVSDLVFQMSEGNPGAIRVLAELLQRTDGFILVLGLDDMNIRGWQIWKGYKDHCNCDLNKLSELIKNRNPEMVDVINNEAIRSQSPERAVINGASFKR